MSFSVHAPSVPWTDTDKLLLSALLPTEAGSARLHCLLRNGKIEWQAALRRAETQGLGPLLRFNLARAGLPDSLSLPVRQKLDAQVHLHAARHLACLSETRRLMQAMNKAGVTVIPLKGAALLSGDYYPQAGLRVMSDLDLLVHPDELVPAEIVAQHCGYLVKKYPDAVPGSTILPPRAAWRLPAELNHAETRTGPGGLLLELHRRAFHYVRGNHDFGFTEMISRATLRHNSEAGDCLLPAAEDLALHLIHHTLVDLRSTHLILRTMADLHFIEQRNPDVREPLLRRAAEFGLIPVTQAALAMLDWLRIATLEQLNSSWQDKQVVVLTEAALQESPAALALAASVMEHYDVQQSLTGMFRSMLALTFTPGEHLSRKYNGTQATPTLLHYPRRVVEVMRKFNWRSLHPQTLRRLMSLRKIGRPHSS